MKNYSELMLRLIRIFGQFDQELNDVGIALNLDIYESNIGQSLSDFEDVLLDLMGIPDDNTSNNLDGYGYDTDPFCRDAAGDVLREWEFNEEATPEDAYRGLLKIRVEAEGLGFTEEIILEKPWDDIFMYKYSV